jgi:hypothetical protein
MTDPSIPFNSYFDTEGQNNILNKLMNFKANRWQDAVGQGYQGVNAAVANLNKQAQQRKQQQALQGLISMLGQQDQPMQGPQLPQPPNTMGQSGQQPHQPFNGVDRNQLLSAAIPYFNKSPGGEQVIGNMLLQLMKPPKTGRGGSETYQAVVGADGSIRPYTAGEPVKQGERIVDLSGSQYSARLAGQASKQDAQRKFETLVTQKTNTTLGPINDALNTTDQMINFYKEAIKNGEVGPLQGRAGGIAAGVTGGKKFKSIFNYQRNKSALISTLFKGLGVNRFTMAEVQNLIHSLPSGGEDPVAGLRILEDFRNNAALRKKAAADQLQSELMIYRGVMMPGGQSGVPEEPPPQAMSDEDIDRELSQ